MFSACSLFVCIFLQIHVIQSHATLAIAAAVLFTRSPEFIVTDKHYDDMPKPGVLSRVNVGGTGSCGDIAVGASPSVAC